MNYFKSFMKSYNPANFLLLTAFACFIVFSINILIALTCPVTNEGNFICQMYSKNYSFGHSSISDFNLDLLSAVIIYVIVLYVYKFFFLKNKKYLWNFNTGFFVLSTSFVMLLSAFTYSSIFFEKLKLGKQFLNYPDYQIDCKNNVIRTPYREFAINKDIVTDGRINICSGRATFNKKFSMYGERID